MSSARALLLTSRLRLRAGSRQYRTFNSREVCDTARTTVQRWTSRSLAFSPIALRRKRPRSDGNFSKSGVPLPARSRRIANMITRPVWICPGGWWNWRYVAGRPTCGHSLRRWSPPPSRHVFFADCCESNKYSICRTARGAAQTPATQSPKPFPAGAGATGAHCVLPGPSSFRRAPAIDPHISCFCDREVYWGRRATRPHTWGGRLPCRRIGY